MSRLEQLFEAIESGNKTLLKDIINQQPELVNTILMSKTLRHLNLL